jgi:hypothetical protein
MILLSEIFEDKKYSAVSKETGKVVYFKTKQHKDAAIKAGTHKDPKQKKVQLKKPVGTPIFPTNGRPNPLPSSRRKEVPIKKINHSHVKFNHHWRETWNDKYRPAVDKLDVKTAKSQAKLMMDITDNTKDTIIQKVGLAMYRWQNKNDNSNLKIIDAFLKKNEGFTIPTKDYVQRGIAVSKKVADKILKDFSNPKTVKLPISSFSLKLGTALQFAVDRDNYNDSKNHSVIFRVKSECGNLKAYNMNANMGWVKKGKEYFSEYAHEMEVLMPSNQRYVVEKINRYKFNAEDEVRSSTIIHLIQKCGKFEGVETENLLDLSEDKFYEAVFTIRNRTTK